MNFKQSVSRHSRVIQLVIIPSEPIRLHLVFPAHPDLFAAMGDFDFDSQSLSKMFKKINGFFNKTSEIMRKVAEATDNNEIKDLGDNRQG